MIDIDKIRALTNIALVAKAREEKEKEEARQRDFEEKVEKTFVNLKEKCIKWIEDTARTGRFEVELFEYNPLKQLDAVVAERLAIYFAENGFTIRSFDRSFEDTVDRTVVAVSWRKQ
jgi:hypothetical protein